MPTNLYQGKQIKNSIVTDVEDHLTIEQALEISINSKIFSITMRSPNNDIELIRGLLYTEDVYRDKTPLNIVFNEDELITKANIIVDEKKLKSGYSNSRNLLATSSCGICGQTNLHPINTNNYISATLQISVKKLYDMFETMNKSQELFKLSGGVHAASAFSINGNLLCSMEDIGRHNAVDKVIGFLLNNNLLNETKVLTVSGRISYEILSKTFAAKIPIIAAVSAPSSLAVDYAKELGITLLGFCRDNRVTCYAHPNRIINLS